MIYTPKRQNNIALALVIILMTAALGCFFGYRLNGVMIIIGFPAAVLGIQFMQRYLLSSFRYQLTAQQDLAGTNDFTAVQIQGAREKTVCNISLYTAEGVFRAKNIRELEKTHGKVSTVYNFCTDMFLASPCWIIESFNEKRIAVKIQCDAEFEEEIKRRIGIRTEGELAE